MEQWWNDTDRGRLLHCPPQIPHCQAWLRKIVV